ncbi:acyl-CoA thioesterase [candidate division KSB1 bacterium]|nr:acyl-CoA thioesterase [candidate division KSB1 bacterium]TDJ03908.1 MAG: acyl-CoA thioesterase [Caldithrix sp.]
MVKKEQTDKRVSETQVEMTEIVLPNDANILGNVLGGKVMHLTDIACAIAAHRHCRRPVVTAAMDSLDFRHPIKVGELIIIKASVNRVFKTSMECGAKVFSENLGTGERKHTSSAYLTFVALDENKLPMQVNPVVPETEDEKRRWQGAEIRREFRMRQKALLRKASQK